MNFEDINFPHIMYLNDPDGERIGLWYLGGEPDENHKRLTIGKLYNLNTKLYSTNKGDLRVRVWTTEDDEYRGKLCRINLENFGTLADLRDRKIEQILTIKTEGSLKER
jgi:hypothetical protein